MPQSRSAALGLFQQSASARASSFQLSAYSRLPPRARVGGHHGARLCAALPRRRRCGAVRPQQGIPVSTRGSVANSLVAYCTGITTVDPIEHGLLFERFLNPARANPPDIDLDFCSRRRDEVLRYLRGTYGAEHVALVGTVSTMRRSQPSARRAKPMALPGGDRAAGGPRAAPLASRPAPPRQTHHRRRAG